MKVLCPYCLNEFVKSRRNQTFCSHSCRQGQYILRKNGLLGYNSHIQASCVNNSSVKHQQSVNAQGIAHGSNGPSTKVHTDGKLTENDSLIPIEQIPPMLPTEGLFTYMVKYQLTLPVLPENFSADLFPHWSVKERRAYAMLNDKMNAAFKRLLILQERKVKVSQLEQVRETLYELTDGFSGLMGPDDYPFTRIMRLVRHKMDKLLGSIKGKDEIEFELPREFADQMMLVGLQTKTVINL